MVGLTVGETNGFLDGRTIGKSEGIHELEWGDIFSVGKLEEIEGLKCWYCCTSWTDGMTRKKRGRARWEIRRIHNTQRE